MILSFLKKYIHFVILIAVFQSGCKEKKDDSIIDPFGATETAYAPIIQTTNISPSSVLTDTILVNGSWDFADILKLSFNINVKVTHPRGPSKIARVSYSFVRDLRDYPIGSGGLLDNGVGADLINGDSIYSAKVVFEIERSEFGNFPVATSAISIDGFESNTIYVPFLITRGSGPPPEITKVEVVDENKKVVDTVQVGGGTRILTVRAYVQDKFGLSNIQKVIFNSYLPPDGRPATNNPFTMYDDGGQNPNSNDEKAGDGIYSLGIQMLNTTPVGIYRFEFRAFDKTNAGSNILNYYLAVRQ